MKIALSTMIVALLLIPAVVWAQQAPKPCFSIVVDLPNGENGCVGTGTAVLSGK